MASLWVCGPWDFELPLLGTTRLVGPCLGSDIGGADVDVDVDAPVGTIGGFDWRLGACGPCRVVRVAGVCLAIQAQFEGIINANANCSMHLPANH